MKFARPAQHAMLRGMARSPRHMLVGGMGCVDAATEFLSPEGWVKISEYTGQQVCQYDPTTESGSFVTPCAYIAEPCTQMLHITTTRGLDQMLSLDHKTLSKTIKGRLRVMPAALAYEEHKNTAKGFNGAFPTAFKLQRGEGIPLSEAQVRVQVAFQADGHITKDSKQGRCIIRIKRQRKKDRLRGLLAAAGIPYTEKSRDYPTAKGYTIFTFEPPLRQKTYESFWQSSSTQLQIIVDEMQHWDGSTAKRGRGRSFSTRVEADAEFMQYALAACGYAATITSFTRDNGTDFSVSTRGTRSHWTSARGTKAEDNMRLVPAPGGMQYCFTVPSGFLVLRRNKRIFCTGNCGKSGAIVLHAGAQELHYGRWPGLFILAPLQVALNWVREVPEWRPDLRVSLVAGTKTQREAAIKKDADVFIMSYDNTPWLDKYGPKNWGAFGHMMACDESTRLRGTRASFQTSTLGNRFLRKDGGAQTNALAAHAADFDMWVNATGTPCPNGMQNWWPQIWYLDGGWRLGNSYTSFEQRWFMDDPYDKSGFPAKVPQPGAVDDILGRISDITTVVRTEDYFNVAAPHIVDRIVELPDSVRKQYTDMKERMALSIDDRKIAVLSPAAKAQKLLQIAAGFAYWRDEDLDPDLKLCEELHTAKIDAVESILNETDEPLVIFYQHQATLQMLQKKFGKRLRELDKKGQAQEDWNNGKIEILACQYQRGGMGLSLQHGGRNICLIEPTFKADDYEQAIERLGPLRQMQSGYNRTVNLFRVIAHNTHDLHVYKKLAAKINLQDYAVDLLKDTL